MTYQIYFSAKAAYGCCEPLLEGNFFGAADIDLDGRIEILGRRCCRRRWFSEKPKTWENLTFAPTVVLRF